MKNLVFSHAILLLSLTVVLLTGCSNPQSLIDSASDLIDYTMGEGACRNARWVVPGGEEIQVTLTNPLAVPQIFIIMARAATPPFDSKDEDRIYFSVPVPPGETRTSFTAPLMPAEYQVICGPADNLEPMGRNLLVVVQPGVK